jgi:hypothetical protein
MSTTQIFRSALGAVIVAAAVAACGGGGGGSSSPIPTSPPGTTGTTPPASTPTPVGATPSPTPVGATPTPVGATPSPSPTAPGASSQTITTSAGAVDGTPNMWTPNEGDTSSGGQGPVGNTIDNTISCEPTMSNNYHIHIFLGVYVNGQLAALPIAIGMDNPGAESSGFINSATCFYYIHTHDSSGIVHVEDPNPNNLAVSASMYTLQNVLDVWGITASPTNFGQFTGPIRVFTSGQTYMGETTTIPATSLTYWGNNPATVPLYSHEVIYVEVGPTWPTTLPNVFFYLEN